MRRSRQGKKCDGAPGYRNLADLPKRFCRDQIMERIEPRMLSQTLSQILFACSAAILLTLGSVHLYLTYFHTSFEPRDATLRAHMDATHPRLTRETTVWRAWIGFNASLSLGVMLFGLVYGYLAVWQNTMLVQSGFLLGLGMLVLVAYVVLARRYWFRVPLIGCTIALLLYTAGALVRQV